jgi:hypothetical protein
LWLSLSGGTAESLSSSSHTLEIPFVFVSIPENKKNLIGAGHKPEEESHARNDEGKSEI